MATRTSYIVQDVLEIVGDVGERDNKREDVVRKLDQVQSDLCREVMALKFEGTLALVVGQEVYDVNGNVESIVEVIEPAAWTEPLEILHDPALWREARRCTTFGVAQPLKGYLWERWLHLWPLPTTAGESLIIYGKGLPESVLTEAADPEVNSRWDEAMKYALVARIAPGKKDVEGNSYQRLYEKERDRVAAKNMKESIKGVLRRRHSSDDLGF